MRLVTVEQSMLATIRKKLSRAESGGKNVRQLVLSVGEFEQLVKELGRHVDNVDGVPVFVEANKQVRLADEYRLETGR